MPIRRLKRHDSKHFLLAFVHRIMPGGHFAALRLSSHDTAFEKASKCSPCAWIKERISPAISANSIAGRSEGFDKLRLDCIELFWPAMKSGSQKDH